jgi:ABC-type transport system involved in multi-copper enzyme maturation permease subunit
VTRDLRTIAGYALAEALRRRVLLVVVVLTAAFLALYALGVQEAYETARELEGQVPTLETRVLTGATLVGLAMFVTLFLGTVLAVFLTLATVRGDAERGLLQPLVVRPVGRTTLLVARFLAASAVCVAYVAAVYAGAVAITGAIGGFWPDRPVAVGTGLAAAVCMVVALSLLGSTVLSTTANGIAVFMVFGAGLAAGLLGQVGEALDAESLTQVARIASWALPFEALYQEGLYALTADVGGLTGVAVRLGPFGGAQDASALLWPYALAYLLLVGLAADRLFRRADL